MESLNDELGSMALAAVCVPFKPTRDNADNMDTNFDNTPRYLFRVYDSKTSGETNKTWVKSMDAVEDEKNPEIDENDIEYHMVDAFRRWNAGKKARGKVPRGKVPRGKVPRGLNEHIRWWTATSGKNNFVSWTNSLPFAITYAIYRMKDPDLKTPLAEISLCVVDTFQLDSFKLPRGVFIKDMDLMKEYCGALESDEEVKIIIKNVQRETKTWGTHGLSYMIDLREMRGNRRDLQAYYYFGEYLSQGKLEIEGASTTISFDKIINSRLYELDPRFQDLMGGSKLNGGNGRLRQ
jgi:hypothetical protein